MITDTISCIDSVMAVNVKVDIHEISQTNSIWRDNIVPFLGIFGVLLAFLLAKIGSVTAKYFYYVNIQKSLRIYLKGLDDMLKKSIEIQNRNIQYFTSQIEDKLTELKYNPESYNFCVDRILGLSQSDLYNIFIYIRKINKEKQELCHEAFNDVLNNLAVIDETKKKFDDQLAKFHYLTDLRNKITKSVSDLKHDIVVFLTQEPNDISKENRDIIYNIVGEYEISIRDENSKRFAEFQIMDFILKFEKTFVPLFKDFKEKPGYLYKMISKSTDIKLEINNYIQTIILIRSVHQAFYTTIEQVRQELRKDLSTLHNLKNKYVISMLFKLN